MLFLAACALVGAEYRFHLTRKRNRYSLLPKSTAIQSELDTHFQESYHDITLIGIHFEKSISDHRGSYEDALKRGLRIKIYCVSPESAKLSDLSRTIGISAEELKQECLTFRTQVLSLLDFARSHSVRGSIEYFCREQPYSYRAYVFDAQHSTGKLIFVPLIDGVRASAAPAIKLCTLGKYSTAIMESVKLSEVNSGNPCLSSKMGMKNKPSAATAHTHSS